MATQSVRIGWRPYVSQVVNAVDADAQAFIAAAGITDLTQATAISTLVNDLKTYGIWSKMKALYPFVGGNATSHKFNLKDPRDLDAAYRLVFSGGWTHTSNGVQPNGTTGYADSKYNPNINGQLNSAHISYYSRTNTSASNAIDIGALSAAPGNYHHMHIRYTGDLMFGLINTSSAVSVSNNISHGLFISSRINSTNVSLYRNNGNIGNVSLNSTTKPNNNIYIGAGNITNLPQQYSSKESAFASIGDGLTDTEATNFYTSIQKFQTTLGRQVGTPYVSDADAISFLTAAGITDGTQAVAINTLVIDLKAAGVWTKMKALYPFVGGTTTSHKFNLKDPRDLDVAYRLVFNGGWTHTSTGALPNGSNGYADTKLNVLSTLTANNNHISYYSRTNDPTSNRRTEMGIETNYGVNNINMRLLLTGYWGITNSFVFGAGNSTSGGGVLATNTDSRGFYQGNILSSSNRKSYKDGTLVGTNTSLESQSLANGNMYIGCTNVYDVPRPFDYTNKEVAFSSIGDGLTDNESAAFYTAVQKFQTTLGRQVNTPVVGDSDAQTFLNAAGITSYTQANAINTLVTDLKSAGIWTKMKALYPFVGGTATTHKFNLKDPRDLDVAYRLTFTGGWVHTSTGAKPNGTNAYARTYLIPSTTFGLNNTILHMSKYQRENLTIGSAYWLEGVYSGVGPNFDGASLKFFQYSFSTTYQGSSNVAIGNFTDSNIQQNQLLYGFSNNTQGYFVFTRTTNTSLKAFRNNSLTGTLTIDITNNAQVPQTEFLYGARNDSWANHFNPFGYNPLENSFSSIGNGLTDTESTAFYTAVQKFQTSLGRQVGTPVYNTNGLVLNLDAGVANSYPGTGTTWFDLAAGNNGTLVNGPTYDINNGGSILFDGVNDNVTFGSNCFGVALNDTISEFTINVWVNWNSFPNNTHDEIVSWWASGTQTYLDGFLGLSTVSYLGFTNTNPTLRFGDGWQDTGVRFNSSTDKNKWWNITAIKTATNAYIYLNGVLVSTKGSALSWGFNNVLNIGSQFTAGEYLNGKLSSVSLYNRALSATEVLQNFNSSRGRFGV